MYWFVIGRAPLLKQIQLYVLLARPVAPSLIWVALSYSSVWGRGPSPPHPCPRAYGGLQSYGIYDRRITVHSQGFGF